MGTIGEGYQKLEAEIADLERKIKAGPEVKLALCFHPDLAGLEALRTALASVGRSAVDAKKHAEYLTGMFDERATIRAEELLDLGRKLAEVNQPYRPGQVEKPKHTGKQNSARNRVISKPAYTAKRK